MGNLKLKQAELSGPVAVLELDNLSRIALIRKFQLSEGNYDCCASSSAYTKVCNHFDCLWRGECMAIVRAE